MMKMNGRFPHCRNLKCVYFSDDSVISLRIANQKKRIMAGFELFQGQFEQVANPKNELTGESCYTLSNFSPLHIIT